MGFPWFSLCFHMIPSTSALPKPARRKDSTSMLSSPQSRRNRPNLMVSLLRTGIISHVLSGVSHQVYIMYNIYNAYIYINQTYNDSVYHIPSIHTQSYIYICIYIYISVCSTQKGGCREVWNQDGTSMMFPAYFPDVQLFSIVLGLLASFHTGLMWLNHQHWVISLGLRVESP